VIDLIKKKKAKLMIAISGGLGLISDTGGRRISSEIIREIGRDNIVTMATPDVLASLNGSPLIVDSSDVAMDEMLSGYHVVITRFEKRAVYKVVSRSRESPEPETREIDRTRY
jgi:predicted polyphosphate/ATP-dependent NAD kinase